MKTIDKILTKEIRQSAISVLQLSRQSGVGYATLTDIIKGRAKNPGILTLRAILQPLNRDLEWLGRQLGAYPFEEEMPLMDYFELNSGEARESRRDEVQEHLIKRAGTILKSGVKRIPWQPAYNVVISVMNGKVGFFCTINRNRPERSIICFGAAVTEAGAAIVTKGLTTMAKTEAILGDGETKLENFQGLKLPWMAVLKLGGDAGEHRWMENYAKCSTWAFIDRYHNKKEERHAEVVAGAGEEAAVVAGEGI